MEERNMMAEEQISTKKGARSVDHMYVLKTLIDKCVGKKKKIVCVFPGPQ